MRRVAMTLWVVAAACDSSARDGATSLRQAIWGGVPAPNDPAVFFIHDSVSACTASLIAPRTLVTARHCVNTGTIFATNPPSSTEMFTGLETRTWTEANPDAGTVDLALIFLDRAPPVTPLRWDWETRTPAAGTTVRLIGYGATDTGGGGERRTVTTTTYLTLFDPASGHLVLSGNIDAGACNGDSGGPALLVGPDGGDEVQLAVNVRLASASCGAIGSVLLPYYRVFIEDWLRTHEDAGCPRDDRCVGACTPADPDCVAPGESCSSPRQCPNGRCASDPQHPAAYCTEPCGAGCPADFQCDSASDACINAQKPEAALSEPCVDGVTFCRAGTCLDGACRTPCTDDAACTVATEHCRELEPRYCAAPVVVPALSGEHPEHRGCASAGVLPLAGVAAALVARSRRRREQ